MCITACVMLFLLFPGQEWALVEPTPAPSLEYQPLITGFMLPFQESSGSPLPFSSNDPQSLLSVEMSSTVAWGELSHSLEQAHQSDNSDGRAWGAIDVVSALTPDVKDARFTTQIVTDAAYTPQTAVKGYKLSRQGVEAMEKNGVPADLIAELMELADREYVNEEQFWSAVEAQMGTESVQQYRQTILASAALTTGPLHVEEPPVVPASWQTSFHNLEAKQAWDAVFYYPKVMRNMLTGKRQATERHLDILEEEHSLFDIIRFFKRWGIPTPLTIVLSGLLVYLMLAFLTRN